MAEGNVLLNTAARLPAQILCSVFSQNWINVILLFSFLFFLNILTFFKYRFTIFFIFYQLRSQICCDLFLPRKSLAIAICICTLFNSPSHRMKPPLQMVKFLIGW